MVRAMVSWHVVCHLALVGGICVTGRMCVLCMDESVSLSVLNVCRFPSLFMARRMPATGSLSIFKHVQEQSIFVAT